MAESAPTYTAAAVRAAEAPLLAAGVPLMRRAAAALAEVIAEVIAETIPEQVAEHPPQRMLVLTGAGDNGGDALFAAAALAERGVRVDVLRTADRLHEEALAAATDAGAAPISLSDLEPAAYDLVVDGILGIGARGGLRGAARDAVGVLLPARPRVIAVDLPSGLDPDTGASDGVVLPAETTVTFGAVKTGLTRGDGPRLCGRIVLVELGLMLGEPVGQAVVDEVRVGHP
ncbi:MULTISPECIES: NAD(P)H-hydrate epimerase [Microbacterium]|uniref:NAD(P)H-hydrate epimerase n=1 Tax=Microbacterium TaxID=33882 RepID=UPI00217D922A|nr:MULTISPECIES: NAD(P)H-hydrate epimerase [Microbacterium]UWF77618.1 NAD(P)H-hydrate epimerase [Microbacterium neungamense]WCM55789.1 NAD(P)H-hydrate epimerase [Microbacterium sp. EF45047]